MVTYFYKQNKKISLNPERRQAICADIKGMFKKYYKDLDPSRQETADILKSLYPDTNPEKMEKVPDLYQQHQTYSAALFRACIPSYQAILDVDGQDLPSNELASTYKASIIYDWENIELMKTLVKILYDWTVKGEAAAYIQWKVEGTDTWTNIIEVASLKGEKGDTGKQVSLTAADGFIKWQNEGDTTWNELISIDSLKGATGSAGKKSLMRNYLII